MPLDIEFDVDLQYLAEQIHRDNLAAGWWKEWLPYKTYRHGTAMGLVVTELAEAAEGARKDLMDDKLPQFKMLHVEIADGIIRLLDLAGAYEINELEARVRWKAAEYRDELRRKRNPIERMWHVNCMIAREKYREDQVVAGIAWLEAWASVEGVGNLYGIVKEKREFNATRPDHTIEHREMKGGKQW